MMPGQQRNWRRWRAVQISRAWKGLIRPADARRSLWRWVAAVLLWSLRFVRDGEVRRAILYRLVFRADDGATLRLAANHVLADLRDYSFARSSAFDPDPIIMARRQGRRDVWLRISNYLELDEAVVQQLMEIDDGI